MADCIETGFESQTEEVLLQSYLFLGYPIALNAIQEWRRASRRQAPSAAPEDWEGWRVRGDAVCRTVYGGQYDRLRENVRRLHPDMERWMVIEGYGKVLGRPALDLATRELCIAALLVVLDAPKQLYSHLRGALNAGATSGQISAAMGLACIGLGDAHRDRAMEVWGRIRDRKGTVDPTDEPGVGRSRPCS
jgi:4-carboxymuconolactone decarboxylase